MQTVSKKVNKVSKINLHPLLREALTEAGYLGLFPAETLNISIGSGFSRFLPTSVNVEGSSTYIARTLVGSARKTTKRSKRVYILGLATPAGWKLYIGASGDLPQRLAGHANLAMARRAATSSVHCRKAAATMVATQIVMIDLGIFPVKAAEQYEKELTKVLLKKFSENVVLNTRIGGIPSQKEDLTSPDSTKKGSGKYKKSLIVAQSITDGTTFYFSTAAEAATALNLFVGNIYTALRSTSPAKNKQKRVGDFKFSTKEIETNEDQGVQIA